MSPKYLKLEWPGPFNGKMAGCWMPISEGRKKAMSGHQAISMLFMLGVSSSSILLVGPCRHNDCWYQHHWYPREPWIVEFIAMFDW